MAVRNNRKHARLNVNQGPFSTQDILIRQDGEIDAKVVRAFTEGHCHSFAVALHNATGWPLVGLYGIFRPDSPAHVVCMHPSGTLVDIEGPGAERRWEPYEPHPITLKGVRALIRNGDYRRLRVDAAAPFVDNVIRQVEDRL